MHYRAEAVYRDAFLQPQHKRKRRHSASFSPIKNFLKIILDTVQQFVDNQLESKGRRLNPESDSNKIPPGDSGKSVRKTPDRSKGERNEQMDGIFE